MASPKQITIKESLKELREYQKNGNELIQKRMAILIQFKKNSETGISKRDLSELTGINHNSIVKWRNMYIQGGIKSMLVDDRKGGFKPSVVSKSEHKAIEKVLTNEKNGISGYSELLKWVKNELHKDMKYITLVKYVNRHFGAKIKVARKSHIKKDKEAVSAFKKTSLKSAKK